MKTTVDIPDRLLATLKRVARQRGMSLNALVIEALRTVKAPATKKRQFRLADASSGGGGMVPGVEEGSWEQIRSIVYEGRGG
jgi:hypothetical protein